jgi:hypothetical protein
MKKFTPIDLTRYFNASADKPYPATRPRPRWEKGASERFASLPRGQIEGWGIPFKLASQRARKAMIVLPAAKPAASGRAIEIPIGKPASYICLLHTTAGRDEDRLAPSIGDLLATYIVRFKDGEEHSIPIRRRFEVGPSTGGWGGMPFAAVPLAQPFPELLPGQQFPWGSAQTGVFGRAKPHWISVCALQNPEPEKVIDSLVFCSNGPDAVAIFAITLYHHPAHPLRHLRRETFRLALPARRKVKPDALKVDMDLGYVTRVWPDADFKPDDWAADPLTGLGAKAPEPDPKSSFLLQATGSEGATLRARADRKTWEVSYGEAAIRGEARGTEGIRLQRLHGEKTWLHVSVVDEATGQPTAVRIRFLGPKGDYLPPYGHPAVVNTNWFEDEGGNIVLGGETYAYVDGRLQIELPVGDVLVEMHKGFEYAPVRRKITIAPGQRELRLSIGRMTNLREQGYVTADTHVHFLSPQTAWLEGQCEGLNLVNLLASQWGRLFTSVGDITGELSGVSRGETMVWVGTENRHHLLGHISMLGTHGSPVFPMCAGGPGEAYFGDPDAMCLAEWADTCRAREGVVISPHFPSPTCEVAADIVLGKLDAAEIRYFDLANGTLNTFSIREWYRYLNCGYRLGCVGGTDKMSAGMPVGGVRTYARLAPDAPFTFANWAEAIRAGRTFTTSGPLISLTVEGRGVGEEIRLPSGGGSLEVSASAECNQPIHRLEVVHNGQIVASQGAQQGAKRLELRENTRVERSGWIAARCFSEHWVWHCWPQRVAAHTSPIYIQVGEVEAFSPADATYMLTLIDGGLTWLDTLSVRYSETRHKQLKAVFQQARECLLQRAGKHRG